MNNNQKIVAYTDLLGFSDLVVTNPVEAKELLSDFYNLAQSTKVNEGFEDLELFLFSDFLFVQGDNIASVVNYMCCLYRRALTYSKTNQHAMLCRGGIARGGVITQKRRQAPNVVKNFIISPALTHAVKMESIVKGQRLLLSANEREELSHFWNNEIKSICYDQPSIKPSKLFLKYKYQDMLWARDLAKEYAQSKQETGELIQIAAKLFIENFKKPISVRAHYSETLRICLLSYASLLEPCATDRELLRTLVKNTLTTHPDESVWLGFLEMVLLSRDAFAFQMEESTLSFLRVALLSPKWGEICKALKRKENAQLYHAVKELVDIVTHDTIDS